MFDGIFYFLPIPLSNNDVHVLIRFFHHLNLIDINFLVISLVTITY